MWAMVVTAVVIFVFIRDVCSLHSLGFWVVGGVGSKESGSQSQNLLSEIHGQALARVKRAEDMNGH